MTDGIAKMTMNDVITIAQTNSGMRLSDMPGRALLEDRGDDLDRADQRGDLRQRDHLRPDVHALARANTAGPTSGT